MGKILYPDRFADIDPKTKSDDIYKFLYGKALYSRMEKDFGPLGRVADLSQVTCRLLGVLRKSSDRESLAVQYHTTDLTGPNYFRLAQAISVPSIKFSLAVLKRLDKSTPWHANRKRAISCYVLSIK